MKTLYILFVALLSAYTMFAQNTDFPETTLKTLDGTNIYSSEIIMPGSFTLLVFWKSTSGKCCENLDDLQNAWTDSLMQKGVKMVAICVDCNGTWSHVKPIVKGKNWEFETYIDVNGDLKRAMGISVVPSTILLDGNGKQICRYNGFCAGSGELVCEKIAAHIR